MATIKTKSTKKPVTGANAQVFTKYATKLVHKNLVTAHQRVEYFRAIKALRELAYEYCEINGIEL